jgi:hypothetical protein
MSSREGSPGESSREESLRAFSRCPGCGQRLDRATRRCPRCRLWLLPLPPAPKPWGRTAVVVSVVALAVGSFLAGMVLQVFLSSMPPDVVVSDQAGVESPRPR